MTVTQWHTYFDILVDKYGSPYFTTNEKDLLFNRAQFKVLDGILGGEETQLQEELLRNNLRVSTVNSTGSGIITDAAINASINAIFYKIRRVEVGGVEARYSTLNKDRTNSFKAPTLDKLRYGYNNAGIYILPATAYTNVKVTVVTEPTLVSYPSTSSTMPEEAHNLIIATAVDLAGIATRDEVLPQLNQLNKWH